MKNWLELEGKQSKILENRVIITKQTNQPWENPERVLKGKEWKGRLIMNKVIF